MIRYLSFACLGLAWVPITLLAGSSRRAPEDAPLKPGGTVTVHFVSTNDRTWWKGVKYPRLIQFTKNGVFLGSEGYLFEDRYLPRLFQQDKGEGTYESSLRYHGDNRPERHSVADIDPRRGEGAESCAKGYQRSDFRPLQRSPPERKVTDLCLTGSSRQPGSQ